MNDPRGSIWRKWDLHIHTPGTKLEDGYGGETDEIWNKFMKSLEESDVKTFGITDYFSIDGYKYLVEQKTKANRLKTKEIFPNIELRLDQSANKESDELNIHIIFDNSLELLPKIELFLSKLPIISTKRDETNYFCIPSDLSKIGYKKACIHIGKMEEILQETFGKEKPYLVFGVANGYGGIRTDTKSPRKVGIAEEIDKKCNAFFGRSQDKQYFLRTDRYDGAKQKPVIAGSDCHSFEQIDNSLGKKFFGDDGSVREITWIKADVTFEGLKQTTYEPDSRIYIGDIPEKWQKLKENPQFYIKHLHVTTKADNDEWFDNIPDVPLNPDLVTIIGNKGSGKSALADILAMTANCTVETYSFLNTDKFLSVPAHKKYVGELTFWDKQPPTTKDFSSPDYDESSESRAVYLSQDFVQKMCEPEKIEALQREIDRVIFKSLTDDERGDAGDLSELISTFSSAIDTEIENEKHILYELNKKIIQFEEYLKPSFKSSILRGLAAKQEELDRLEKNGKPKEVKPPTKILNDSAAKSIESIRANIKTTQTVIEDTQKLVIEKTSDKKMLLQFQQQVEMLASQIASFKQTIERSPIAVKYSINPANLALNIPTNKPITDVLIKIDLELKTLMVQKSEKEKEKLALETQLGTLQNSISAQEKGYQDYQAKIEAWEKKKRDIIGAPRVSGTIESYKRWISFIDNEAQTLLNEHIKQRNAVSERIAKLHFKKMTHIENIYGGVRDFTKEILQSTKIDRSEFIEISSGLTVANDFENTFLSMINQKKRGTFSGLSAGNKQFKMIVATFSPNDENTLIHLPQLLMNSLQYDLTLPEDQRTPIDIEEQLLDPKQKESLYNLLYSYGYIETRAEITYSGKRLKNLSPGEKGTLLLIFFLLIDTDRRPIIVDQPEENLDNETVYKILVPLIKRVKSERQIIIVTHNPNLAVVTDSEQIIRSSINKERDNKITYLPGSIESHRIRESVVNVLEGTEDAFKNRRNKYELKD